MILAPQTATREPGRLLAERLGMRVVGTEGHDIKVSCPYCPSSDAGRVHAETGVFYCHSCKAKSSPCALTEHRLHSKDAAVALLVEVGIFQPREVAATGNGNGKPRIVATYDYCDEEGRLLFQVCRLEPGKDGRKKEFRQRRLKAGGGWEWSAKGCRLVPYRLPDLLKCGAPLILEGEKDCDRAAKIGIFATCNAMGAGKWRAEYNEHFRGKEVAIICDNDQPGRDHGQHVARSLLGVAKSVKLIDRLPGVQEKGDLSDWLDMGHTPQELVALVDSWPEWTPPPAQAVVATAGPVPASALPNLAPGTRVRAADRGNIGEVVEDHGQTVSVHFVSPEGQHATKDLPRAALTDLDGKCLDPAAVDAIDYGLITAGELLRGSYTIEWLIPHVMAKLQHMLWGGPLKACKSLTAIDATAALALGGRFLGHFQVSSPTRVMFLSGESGWPVLQENVRRISRAMGASDEQLDANLVVGVRLPKFGVAAYVEALSNAIQKHGSEVVFLDCAYRCIPGDNTANVFAMGELLDSVGRVFEDTKCTLVLLHHSPKHIPVGDPLQLDNLAFAGFAEFAAQWALLNRRTAYQPGSGHHDLWLTVGGRAGHSGVYGVQVDEGEFLIGRDRDWRVEVTKAEEVWQEVKATRQAARQADQVAAKQHREEEARVAITRIMATRPFRDGESKEQIRVGSGVHPRHFPAAFGSLIQDGSVVCVEIRKGKRTMDGYKLSEGQPANE